MKLTPEQVDAIAAYAAQRIYQQAKANLPTFEITEGDEIRFTYTLTPRQTSELSEGSVSLYPENDPGVAIHIPPRW